MHIGIDASRTTAAQRTGTENYSLHLLRALLKLNQERPAKARHRFSLYFNQRPQPGFFPTNEHCRQRAMPFPHLWTHLRLSWEMAWRPPDVLFVPAHVLPLIHPRPSVVTIHDLGHLYYPETYPPLDWLYLHLSTRYNAQESSRIIADSETTKKDLVERLGVPADKIKVIYPGFDEFLYYRSDAAEVAAVKARYGIEGEYFLHLGTIKPRKNIGRLLQAFVGLQKGSAVPVKLVLAGRRSALEKAALPWLEAAAEGVIFTGYMAEEDLPALLSGALALVIPSLYEGFGLPALEAMACGTPVVASNRASLPEVVGEAGLLVDPLSVEAIASAMALLLGDGALRQELGVRGQERAGRFSWRRAAQETTAVLEAAV